MTAQKRTPPENSIWAADATARLLRTRVKTFYNPDYFERIIIPLLNIPPAGQVLDVGCGYGGLSLLLARARPDLRILGIDMESGALDNAAQTARQAGLANVTFERGDAHKLPYEDGRFEAVLCQTLLTHVRDPETVVREMARLIIPGGVFMAAEYTNSGAWAAYQNPEQERDEAWYERYFRLARLFMRGKQSLGRGDDRLGNRVPALANAAGLDVFDVRLNDRVLHVIPPYQHPRQADYVELLRAVYAPDPDGKALAHNVEFFAAAGGTEDDARWFSNAADSAAIRQGLDDRTLSMVSAYMLYLTFARKAAGDREES